jgi:two-component system sensor histidine kinase/response regulator
LVLNKIDKIKILYIDDEQNNLNGFKATFRFDYNVFVACNVKDAYGHLSVHPDIRVILCDQRMPDTSGVQFFEEVRIKHPDPIRILITGYADIESVIDAVNRGHIFRYIKKPWTDADIRSAIEEANKFYQTHSLLVSKNRELESAYDELGKFAYSVTHDVRGPLLSVLGALDLAKSMEDLTELREILSMMDDAIRKLDEYIKNTHEYYKLKRGMLQFEKIDFSKLVDDIAALFRIAGKMENIRFTANIEQEQPFYSDEISIKMILNNLLSNAFNYQRKHATDKYVDVNVELKNNNAIIMVQDNGIGIHDEHINNIFTMFYRATSEETGSGLGLYNVKDALNKLNGAIEVQSAVNVGTTFKVIIPGKNNVAS